MSPAPESTPEPDVETALPAEPVEVESLPPVQPGALDAVQAADQAGHLESANAANPYAAEIPKHAQPRGDETGGLIPYKNPHALIGYYCGVFSLCPVIGNLLGLVALILGCMGLNRRKQQPHIGGVVHAWIAIILGGLTFLFYNGIAIAMILAAATG